MLLTFFLALVFCGAITLLLVLLILFPAASAIAAWICSRIG